MASYSISRLTKRSYLYNKKEFPSRNKRVKSNSSIVDWDIVSGKKKVLITTRKRTLKDRMKRMF